ncbi:serine/threonine-protein kinase/endoribonuclease IRE1 isoform X2 [Daphnia magna]|uniref:serine/threonine-protein kinase/endoribonuclease IRE1 isoform X2 n=1 Tax=Daphnia magna TaxID=35525 RepID=UPI001E1BDABF|nr:serine/threonine-protein kinase/endoribonuclease IRE1 isoform X2 [Daphnia magna]
MRTKNLAKVPLESFLKEHIKEKRVAIKRIPVEGEDLESKAREINEAVIPMELNHENVMKLLHVDYETDERYLFLVLELCAGTLEDCVKKGKQGFNLPGDAQVLYQIANGLDYIHVTNLVHRDIKPENILISLTSPAQMKISDFGFCKKVNARGSFSQSALKGTLIWMAPEMLMIWKEADDNEQDTLPRGTIQSDTYSAGCVFFYFLTNGSHPFGISTSTIPSYVLKNNPKLLIAAEKLPKDHFAYNLIEKMIKRLPERIMLPEVMKQLHPLLSASKRKFRLAQKTLTRADMIDFVQFNHHYSFSSNRASCSMWL